MLMSPFPAVALYAALNALILLTLGILVVRARVQTRTEIGMGDDARMVRAVRAHGNNAEYVPVALMLMLILLPLQANIFIIHSVGGTLTVGRILHAFGLSRHAGPSLPRLLGMILTWISYLVAIVAIIWLTLQLPLRAPG